ncbi:unnamed protein product [marine sediment metagenome]|uniref:Uncharacterized protein n=1 Tax=marine sediment metagenome TaxID=412755 RepID=X1B4N5_9ZZZZ
MAYSWQNKIWYDGTEYWRAYFDGTNKIVFDYSTIIRLSVDPDDWTRNTSADITDIGISTDLSVTGNGSYAHVAYSDGTDVIGVGDGVGLIGVVVAEQVGVTLGVGVIEGEGDGEAVGDGVIEGVGLTGVGVADGVGLIGVGVTEDVGEGVTVGVGVTVGLGVTLGVGDIGVGVTVGLGVTLGVGDIGVGVAEVVGVGVIDGDGVTLGDGVGLIGVGVADGDGVMLGVGEIASIEK